MAGKALIIGAGLGELALSALLAKRGWEVTILEKNSQRGKSPGVGKRGLCV